MKSLDYYTSRVVRIFSPECPQHSEECYSWDGDFGGLSLCADTRGWFSNGTRCQYFKRNRLLSKLAEKITNGLLHIGGLEE